MTVVAVVMPVRNVEATVQEQLAALAEQDLEEPWELIVVDDGSIDETVSLVNAWRGKISRLRVLSTERGGAGHARNVGTRASTSKLIAYCDGDDVVGPSWLSGLVDQLQRHQLATGVRDFTKLNPSYIYAWYCPAETAAPRFAGYLLEVNGANLGVQRDAFDSVGGFDEGLLVGQDIDFSWRVQLAGGTVGLSSSSVLHYRFRRGWGYFIRHVDYGRAQTNHYMRFRSKGMPRHPWLGLARLVLAVISCPLVLYRPMRYRWFTSAGISVGRLIGCVQRRTIYL